MTASAKRADGSPQALAWRVLVAVPPSGFGGQLATMRAWLDTVCGPGNWASAPAGLDGVVNNAVAFYFADAAFARTFIGRFSCGYRPPPCHAI